jgi:16S rRNA processing protein RimM
VFYAGDSGIAGEFITLARVLKTQGRRGEVATEPHSDVPDRFHQGMQLWALPKDESEPRRQLKVEELWPHKGYLVLKFEGIDSISEAETLIGSELQIPAGERAELEQGWAYISDLVGCAVFDGDREIGLVADVQFGAGEAPLLIVKSGSKEYEIPYAEAYLKSADLEHKQIRMMLPEGMLELNAPLTAEEKEQQKISNKKM